MSASQALREFDRWDDPEALEQVVPALLAVVEAAEKHVDEEWTAFAEFGEPEQGDMPPNTSITNTRLVDALAALDAKLSVT